MAVSETSKTTKLLAVAMLDLAGFHDLARLLAKHGDDAVAADLHRLILEVKRGVEHGAGLRAKVL